MSLRELAEHTPESRDRYVDFLRAFSILAVVVGHWTIGVIWWQAGFIRTTSAIGITPWLWLATWFLQVMPLFFFVGGFSNLVSFDAARKRGTSTRTWVWSRCKRLLIPSGVFLGVWTAVQIGLHLLDIGSPHAFLRGMQPPGATVPFGPLWFLPVYVIVLCIHPWMLRLHRRYGFSVIVFLVAAAAITDIVGFGIHRPGLRFFNVAFIWLLPHQLGYFYAEGTMTRMSRRALAAMALAGLAILILLTNPPIFFGHGPEFFSGLRSLPKSLLGTDLEPITNTYPPTFTFVGMTLWSIGIAMLLRNAANGWLRNRRPWSFTIAVNSVIMTIYLWHMTAFLIAVLLLWPLGLGHEHASTARWWIERIPWIAVSGVILFGLLAVFGRFERRGLAPPKPAPASAPAPVV